MKHRKIENDFYDRIYQLVAAIPEGCVATYGQLAALLGKPRGARSVGWALHNVPRELHLPCHRVVNRQGTLAPADVFGGPGHQRARLAAEGITFTPSGTIKMAKHLWRPDDNLLPHMVR